MTENLAYCRSGSRRRSFTLAELVIVVLILGILASVAVPNVGQAFGDMALRSAAQTVTADINYLRNLAIVRGEEYGLIFSSTGYSAFVKQAGAEAATAIEHPLTHQRWAEDFSDENVSLKADFNDEESFTFDAFGAPSSAGTILLATRGRSLTVSVQAATGRVSVSE